MPGLWLSHRAAIGHTVSHHDDAILLKQLQSHCHLVFGCEHQVWSRVSFRQLSRDWHKQQCLQLVLHDGSCCSPWRWMGYDLTGWHCLHQLGSYVFECCAGRFEVMIVYKTVVIVSLEWGLRTYLSLTLTHSHTHSLTHSLSLSLTHSLTLSLSLSLSLSLIFRFMPCRPTHRQA